MVTFHSYVSLPEAKLSSACHPWGLAEIVSQALKTARPNGRKWPHVKEGSLPFKIAMPTSNMEMQIDLI